MNKGIVQGGREYMISLLEKYGVDVKPGLTLGELFRLEYEEAARRGLYCPEAGLPEIKEIESFYGVER
jgi:hypothetical protein